jgi:hypothetical protein
MKCPTCSRDIPNGKLACIYCLQERNHGAALNLQLYPLQQMKAHRSMLTVRHFDGVRHAQMVGVERTFCYQPVETYHRRGATPLDNYLAYDERVCEKCQHQIAALLQEVAKCSA